MPEYDPANMDWLPRDSAMPSLIEHWRRRSTPHLSIQVSDALSVALAESVAVETRTASVPEAQTPALSPYPDVLLQAAVVVLGDRTSEGHVIAGVAVPWFEIIAQLERDPEFLFRIGWRRLEEIVAGAYERAGWPEVVLTPRSGDRGRDVVATRPGVGSIRIVVSKGLVTEPAHFHRRVPGTGSEG